MQHTNDFGETVEDGRERAVSPVIGVILMVAITVVLAAVIGTFVLNQGAGMDNSGPTAQLAAADAAHDYDPSDPGLQDVLTLTHNGGEAIDGDSIRVVLRNGSTNAVIAAWQDGWTEVDEDEAELLANGDALDGRTTIATGDVLTLRVNGSDVSGLPDRTAYRIQVVHPASDLQLVDATVRVS